MREKTVHVISHTHWDFEWYFTHSESSVQLAYHMDDLFQAMAAGTINHYILDGQMSIVEDYLNLVPENREKLVHWADSGKLKIGPWYTQCDQLIVAGESIVRNLLLGIRSAEKLSSCWKVGYVPDAFGQSIDMPKIYNGFGIQRSVFWRGLSQDVCASREFNWKSEDGSQVQCYQLRNGYYLAEPQISGMAPDAIVDMIAKDTTSQHVPMPFGADQIKVEQSLDQRIKAYNEQTRTGHHFQESSYDALFDAINEQDLPLPTVQGEMIDAQFSKIHRSIYSTRYDHKQLNDQIETRLTHILEPLMLLASHITIPYKQSLINDIWKQLLRCHAHDSAGGCNSDRTNDQILHRLIYADQMSSASVDFLVHKLSESAFSADGSRALVFYNTLPFPRYQRSLIELDTQTPSFSIYDNTGNKVTCTVLKTEKRYRGSIRRSISEQDDALYYYHHCIELVVALPALGLRTFGYQEQNETNTLVAISDQQSHSQTITNNNYQIEFCHGQLILINKKTLEQYPNFLSVRDMGDDGDNYDYSPPQLDWILNLNFDDADVSTQITALSQTLYIKGNWYLPSDLIERTEKQISGKIAYALNITLSNNEPLNIELEIDNQVNDHRMQLVIDSRLNTTTSIADTPFGTVTRPHVHNRMHDWRIKGWKEEPSCIYPLLHHVSLSTEEKTLTALCCGIKEYEVIQPADQQQPDGASGLLALTLFRSVGWLGKPDLQRRPGIASGQQFKYIPTPDSQLRQKMTFKVGIIFADVFHPAQLMKQWQQFAVPALSYQQQELNRFTNTMKYFGVNSLTSDIPNSFSLLEIDAPSLVVSAIKAAETDNAAQPVALVVRLFNPQSEALEQGGYITIPDGYSQAFIVNLSEEVVEQVPVIDSNVQLGWFAAKQIKSFRFDRSDLIVKAG